MSIFVSYSRDPERVTQLVQALRVHGLRTWRDQDSLASGEMTRDAVLSELASCDAAMVWLGGGTLDSDYVRNIELPAIFENNGTSGLRIVPLFVDVSPADGIAAVRAATGLEIGDHNGHVLGDGDFDAFVARVAAQEVRARLSTAAQDGRRPVVRCVTRSDAAGGRDAADLNFNWIREYPSDGTLPDEPTAGALQRAMHQSVQHVIAVFGAGDVDLYLNCHLHIGVALGFEFRRVTGARPRVAVRGEWWPCGGGHSATSTQPLRERGSVGHAGAARTAVEIALSRDTAPLVSSFIAASDTRYRQRTHLAPDGGVDQHAVRGENINAWADQCADAIRRGRGQPGVGSVDVFMAAPTGFAVALGWRLNAVGGVRLFHLEGNAGPYRHVWTLQSS